METKKRLLSGIKPSGRPHIGNYFGAMKRFAELAQTHESFVFIADYHALNSVHSGDDLRSFTRDLALDYLALGLFSDNVVLFRQSDIPEHTELCWIFNTVVSMPFLMRAHAYKDAVAKDKEINVGTFDYPVLMSADILLYKPDLVPTGADQKQHVEYARDIAQKFNARYGETFSLPEAHIAPNVATVLGIDGRKMSKSYHNTIPLFGSDEEIRAQCMSITTDSKGVGEPKDPETCTVFALHRLVSGELVPELEKRYRAGTIGYKESKELLAERIIALVHPLREKRKEFEEKTGFVEEVLARGAEKARSVAKPLMEEVRKKIGVR
jgi:tryptophanyl-tRNA synthetase